MRYLRFGIATIIFYPVTWGSMLFGGWGLLFAPVAIFATHLVMDNFLALDESSYEGPRAWVADIFLYLHVPCAAVTYVLLMWQVAPGDLLNIGKMLSSWFGSWVMESHRSYTWWTLLGCGYVAGLMLSTNTIVGHELVHRRSSPLAMLVGRWLLALNGDAQFSISHVYGHHMRVATPDDPATARRGESMYRFALRSSIGQYREAAEIERKRLERAGRGFWTWRNQLLQSIGMSAVFVALSYWCAGTAGVALWLFAAIVTKFLFENVNYIQHYGLVRIHGTRVEPRHSWDCNTAGATWVFYGLARHSHHHNKPVLPYWQLMPLDKIAGSPRLDIGYIGCMLLAAVPPLWFRWTTPRLLDWDRRLASPEELELAKMANQQSKYRPLIAASTNSI
jgi:fatty acid desaturase